MKTLIVALFTVIFSNTLMAMECPITMENNNYLETVAQLAADASSCYEASEIVTACALGASGDVYTVSSAIGRCEKDLVKISKEDKKSLEYLKRRCNEKYSSMEGTLYRSANAFCQLSATLFYSNLLVEEGN